MIEGLISFYSPKYPKTLIYMLQRSEYQVKPYIKWHRQTSNFDLVIRRGKLEPTNRAKLLLLLLNFGIFVQVVASLLLIYMGIIDKVFWQLELGGCLLISYPLVWAYLITLPLLIAKWLIVDPKERKLVARSKNIFRNTKAVKIAVAGSYGKTTMKELLAQVLSEGKIVAVTPANKNVATSHAEFAAKLSGNEDIVVVEFGEGRPGDVVSFTETIRPDIGVITGLAPAHLDHYENMQEVGEDIFALADYLKNKNVYVNGESGSLDGFVKPTHILYSSKGVGNYKVSNINIKISGTSFNLDYSGKKLHLMSSLLGQHQVGPLAAVAVIALKLGLSVKQVEAGIAKTIPFEHRMQPRLVGGAWVIDDTYNGNIDGIRAGVELLKMLKAKRKTYITPGLVDQGIENQAVHETMGRLIASANPDIVVLMQNSVTGMIQKGLTDAKYSGEVKVEADPLGFYTNLEQFVAVGDLVMMQNDWPDNYY